MCTILKWHFDQVYLSNSIPFLYKLVVVFRQDGKQIRYIYFVVCKVTTKFWLFETCLVSGSGLLRINFGFGQKFMAQIRYNLIITNSSKAFQMTSINRHVCYNCYNCLPLNDSTPTLRQFNYFALLQYLKWRHCGYIIYKVFAFEYDNIFLYKLICALALT